MRSFVCMLACFIIASLLGCEQELSVRYQDLLGTWQSESSPKRLSIYTDNTWIIRDEANGYHRGIFVLQEGKKPLFFSLEHNHRVSCYIRALQRRRLTVGGDCSLAGDWSKVNNNFSRYW